jgi:hypothetical protein
MTTKHLQILGILVAFDIVFCPSATDAFRVSTDEACATYPYVNAGYGESNPFGTCSGNGECVQTNLTGSEVPEYECVCDDGWTGRSDWINGDGYDCGINFLAVQGLWAANLTLTIVLLVKSIPHIRLRVSAATKSRKLLIRRGKKYSHFKNRGLMSVAIVYIVVFPAVILMGIVRIADTHLRVGLDVLPTILFSTMKCGFYVTSYLYSPKLLAAVLRGQKSMHHIVWRSDRAYLFLCVLSVALGFLPLVNLLAADENGAQSESVNRFTFRFYTLGFTIQVFGLAVLGKIGLLWLM